MNSHTLALLLAAAVPLQAAVFSYDIKSGKKQGRVEWQITQTAEKAVELISFNAMENVSHWAISDVEMSTVEWRFENPRTATDYQVTRVGNRLNLKGVIKGQPIESDVNVRDLPWYQFHGLSFPHLLALGEREINFISVRPENGRVMELQATWQGVENITVHDQQVQTMRVDVRMNGVAARLGKVSYWFRTSDYVFVRFEGASPFGGHSAVIYELAEITPAPRE